MRPRVPADGLACFCAVDGRLSKPPSPWCYCYKIHLGRPEAMHTSHVAPVMKMSAASQTPCRACRRGGNNSRRSGAPRRPHATLRLHQPAGLLASVPNRLDVASRAWWCARELTALEVGLGSRPSETQRGAWRASARPQGLLTLLPLCAVSARSRQATSCRRQARPLYPECCLLLLFLSSCRIIYPT